MKKENNSIFASGDISSYLEPGSSDVGEEALEPEEDRETVMETKVGVPGFNAYRTVEEYESEDGTQVRERRTEVRILGVPLTLDYGEVKGDPLEDKDLEEFVD